MKPLKFPKRPKQSSTEPLTFGIIGGFGQMASPMARHLTPVTSLKIVRVYDRGTQSPRHDSIRAEWQTHGAELVSSYSKLIGDGDLDGMIVCCGKNGDDVSIIAELARRLANSSRGTIPIILHLSTVSARFVEGAQIYCAEREVRYVNYPLTGGALGAENASMLILASGDEQVFDLLAPSLEKIGKPKFLGSSATAGCETKLIGHSMVFNGLMGIATAIALHSECFQHGEIGGSEQTDFFEYLNQGAGGTKQWEIAASRGVRDGDWEKSFAIRYAAVDAIYTADLCRMRKLSRLTVDSLLNVALAFSFVALHSPQLATQAIIRELLANRAADLDEFVKKVRRNESSIDEVLRRCVRALPKDFKDSVFLDISNEDFGVAEIKG